MAKNDTTAIRAGETAQGENQSTISEAIMHIHQSCIAAQSHDTKSVLMNLTLALNALGFAGNAEGNTTVASTTSDVNDATSSKDGISVSRTSSSDDSDAIESHAEDTADDSNGHNNSDESNTNTDENRQETDANNEDSECGRVTVGGTSAADDYGCPPDPDY